MLSIARSNHDSVLHARARKKIRAYRRLQKVLTPWTAFFTYLGVRDRVRVLGL